MMSHEELILQRSPVYSFDRVTDTVWFNNEMTVGSVTSVPQSHAHTYPMRPPVTRYR